MTLKTYKPYTAGMRNRNVIDFSNLSKIDSEKTLTQYYHRAKGRNNQGQITTRHKGGGHKRLYRTVDFKRRKEGTAKVITIEYDPNRSANVALICYQDGTKRYILHPESLNINDEVTSGLKKKLSMSIGSSMALDDMSLGTEVHNIELYPGKGGQIARSAGAFAKILAKENDYVILRLRSKEIRYFHKKCLATIGRVSNSDHSNIKLGKAGRKRWLGVRPTVRGSAMNPIDHPHGGGEGRCPIGKPRPLTPWGKIALGAKTRKSSKTSDKFIIKSR